MVDAIAVVVGASGKTVASPGWGVGAVPDCGATGSAPVPKVGNPVAVGAGVNGVAVLGSVWAIPLFEKKPSKVIRVITLKRHESIC